VGISYNGRTYAEGKKIGWRDGVRAVWCILKFSPVGDRLRAGAAVPAAGSAPGGGGAHTRSDGPASPGDGVPSGGGAGVPAGDGATSAGDSTPPPGDGAPSTRDAAAPAGHGDRPADRQRSN